MTCWCRSRSRRTVPTAGNRWGPAYSPFPSKSTITDGTAMRIAQSDKYEGNDWWSWSVWIDGTAEELRGIESVTYTLHPTFANPVRRVTDRRSKFRLDENGWGGFMIYGRVEMKAGKTRNLKR